MKVIKAGEPEKAWPREIEVECCKSILEIEPADIKTDRDYTGDFNGYFINCPVCGGQPTIKGSVQADARRWTLQQERITHP